MSIGRYFGFALEEEFGVLPQTPIWAWTEFGSESINPPDEQYSMYEGSTSRAAFYAAPGDYVTEGDVAIPADIDNIGWILLGVLGKVASEQVGATDFYKHTFTAADMLPTFRIAVGKELYEHNFEGMTFTSLEMNYEDNFVVLGLDVIGGKDSKNSTPHEISVCDLPESILTSLMSVFTRNNSDITPEIEEFTLNIDNNVNVEDAVPAMKRFPEIAFPEGLEIELEMDISFDSLDNLETFWGGADGPTTEVQEDDIEINFIKEEDEEELKIKLPSAVPMSYSNPVEGRSRIEQSISYSAKIDTAECEAIIVELINDREAYEIMEEEGGE